MTWTQHYDPLGNTFLSTAAAALPVIVLVGAIALGKMRIHTAAVAGLAAAVLVALFVYGMPGNMVAAASAYGAAYGLFPIGWLIVNLLFLYELTVRRGLFDVLHRSLSGIAPDPRVQVILIAFSFGAFFEGAAGFGTPVAVTAVIMIRLGFRPLHACCLSLIANTAPVAFGSLGTPLIALAKVSELDLLELSAMAGRQLPFFSLLVPFWVVWAFAGWRGMLGVWPAALTAGLAFAVPQYLVSNFHGPWLVDIVASVASIGALLLLLKRWQPSDGWRPRGELMKDSVEPAIARPGAAEQRRAWTPWVLLALIVAAVGGLKGPLSNWWVPSVEVPGLHAAVYRSPPVAPEPTAAKPATPEKAVLDLNLHTATGTGILLTALITGLWLRFSPRELVHAFTASFWRARWSLITIAAMLSLGHLTKFCGADATMGLALAGTGALYPFFGTMLGWLGVALTGSDTASNVLFGSLQHITADRTGISANLMCAANSTGGVMGKMIDAQSIVVASTAADCYGMESRILRRVFFHSIALAMLVAGLVTLQAYVWPFTEMVVK
jgi:lactate permease